MLPVPLRNLLCASLLTLVVPLQAQKPLDKIEGRPAADAGGTLRVFVNLVQVDAVVTDKDGTLVTDLKAEDFEVLQDGRAQKITNFSYIQTQPERVVGTRASNPRSDLRTPPTKTPLTLLRQQVRRTLAVVVDDL